MSARRLSLHPSALSDAEHALFTASLADLADVDSTSNDNIVMDWNRISVRVREARAWLCGRYASLGTGTIDEILRLFPASTLGGGAFFALLRLVLHTQAGGPIDRSLVFVQAPVAAASRTTASNPFLPTPAPSPESRPTTSHSNANSNSFTSSTGTLNVNGRFISVVSPAPPMHPLRRASTQTRDAVGYALPSGTATAIPEIPGVQLGRTSSNANPFRAGAGAPPLPPRCTSTSNSLYAANVSASHYSSSNSHSTSNSHPRTASPTRSAFAASDVWVPPRPPPLPSPSNFNSTSNSSVYSLHSADTFESAPPFSPASTQFAFVNGDDKQNGPRHAYPASANPRVSAFSTSASASGSTSAFSTSLSLDHEAVEKAEKPPVYPHRRGTSGGGETSPHASDFKSDFNTGSGAGSSTTRHGSTNGSGERRVHSDSAASSFTPSSASFPSSPPHPSFPSNTNASFGPLALPKAIRRAREGAGWVSPERGEREGLVSGASNSHSETYAGRQRGNGEEGEEGEEGGEWGAL
ncbi:hypothetical protein B0H13DRAFT_2430874 [Mycena leptocephala]|nr:hypothetical protein B0H13DRAFT_2430874 [Mycena leptocephala]